jgi:hypothetical protein
MESVICLIFREFVGGRKVRPVEGVPKLATLFVTCKLQGKRKTLQDSIPKLGCCGNAAVAVFVNAK